MKRIRRGIEAMRDLRAAKMGITRKALDRIEGRAAEGTDRIEIVDYTEYHKGKWYYVEGVVKNKTADPVEYSVMRGVALNASGKVVQVEEAMTSPSDIPARGTATFRLMFSRGKEIDKVNLKAGTL